MLGFLFPFLGSIAGGTVGANIKAVVKKTKLQALCSAFIGAALFFAALFICQMLFFCLWSVMSPIKAAAIMALVWLLIAFIGVIVMKISLERQKKAEQKLADKEQKRLLAGSAIAAVPGLLALGAKSYKSAAALTALTAGAVAVYGLFSGKKRPQKRGKPPAA